MMGLDMRHFLMSGVAGIVCGMLLGSVSAWGGEPVPVSGGEVDKTVRAEKEKGEKGEKVDKTEKGKKGGKVTDLEGMRKWLRGLTEEQRARVFENLQKWSEMTPDQQMALRNREEVFRKKVQEEIAQACEGLKLSAEDQKMFTRKYMEERKAVEAGIRKDMEERRKLELQALRTKLQEEFRGRTGN
jgi:hypothetical protein